MPSLIFDKYEIIRRIAVGGMGEIFLARQSGVPGFDRLVILKSLLPDSSKDESRVERFLDEARVAAKLNHPNIVAIYEVGLWKGTYFIAMEYINGATVAEILSGVWDDPKREKVPFQVAAHIAHDSAIALEHAHRALSPDGKPLNIIHRDISPQNIMVREDGVTKVVDFGIAKATNRYVKTATGKVHGKLAYMSPEQARAEQVDARSDQFSLGVVLWEMCAGQRLFTSLDPMTTLTKLMSPAPPLESVCTGCPPLLNAIVTRMLSLRREDRFPTCGEAAEALRTFLESASQEYGTSAVARFVQVVCGSDIKERVTDLTPSGEDFVISLVGGQEERVPLAEGDGIDGRKARAPARRSLSILMAGITAALVLGVAAAWLVRAQISKSEARARADAVAEQETAQQGVPVAAALAAPPILEISSQPSAAVLIAGQVVGQTPLTLDSLAPGVEHLLQVKRSGYRPHTIRVTLEKGKREKRDVTLERLPRAVRDRPAKATPPPKPAQAPAQATPQPVKRGDGTFTLRTKPWTQVTIDGRPYGTTPLFKLRLSAGKHALRLVNPEAGIDHKQQIDVPPGENLRLDLNLKR